MQTDTIETRPASRASPTTRTVLFDERCALCRRCRDWLLTQPCHCPVILMPSGSEEARRRFGAVPWLGQELVAVDDQGRVWVGPAAFLTCLWATVRFRSWAYRLAGPHLAPLAEAFFRIVSKRRDRWSAWLDRDRDECTWCDRTSDPTVGSGER
jgi:predicted DCC family thiol-disulfide oxidoreductase YuxK